MLAVDQRRRLVANDLEIVGCSGIGVGRRRRRCLWTPAPARKKGLDGHVELRAETREVVLTKAGGGEP